MVLVASEMQASITAWWIVSTLCCFTLQVHGELSLPRGTQQSLEQVQQTLAFLDQTQAKDILMFSVGYDSSFWMEQVKQRGGEIVFLEDSSKWANLVRKRCEGVEIHIVKYHTLISRDFKRLVHEPKEWCSLKMNLPARVRNKKWSVVIVDGPMGFLNSKPGRFQSLFEASQLVVENGYVVVDDCDRRVEKTMSSLFFGSHNMVANISRVVAKNHQCTYQAKDLKMPPCSE